MEQQILTALTWPVRDLPKVFDVGTLGFAYAAPAFAELGVVAAGLMLMGKTAGRHKGTGWMVPLEMTDVALIYGAAAAISFVMNR